MSVFPIEPPLPPGTKRLLVVGGTFAPPHRAHLRLALDAARAAPCDHLLFVPARQSPHKDEPPTPAKHRAAMLRLALEDEPLASMSLFEIERTGKSYTIDTLIALRAALPADVELRLFMGSDQLRSLPRWREADHIVQMAMPVVVLRPPDTRESLRAAGVESKWLEWIVDVPVDEVSSTAVRAAIARGEDASALVEPRVLEYIRTHGLYERTGMNEDTGTGSFVAPASAESAPTNVPVPFILPSAESAPGNVPVPFIRESLDRLRARLAAAGVAEPSTLVIECAGQPGRHGAMPRTAMSSRVPVPQITDAAFHPKGLAEGYCTYAIQWQPVREHPHHIISQLTDFEQLALALREAVQSVQHQGVPVRRFVLTGHTDACGSIDRTFAQAIADVLDTRVAVRPCRDVPQRGAEILRQLRRDRDKYASISQAIKALADIEGREQRVWRRLERAREISRLLRE